jgi:hypothetical protein
MISIGEWKDFIEYTIFLEDVDSDFAHTSILNTQFENLGGSNDYKISIPIQHFI